MESYRWSQMEKYRCLAPTSTISPTPILTGTPTPTSHSSLSSLPHPWHQSYSPDSSHLLTFQHAALCASSELTSLYSNLKECSNYHTIALITHASKVMLKILQARLQQYLNHELPDVQAGFRKGRGTRDQIANTHWIIEKTKEFQKNIYFCFIDYAKAFDCVYHNKLWKILQQMGIPEQQICLLRNRYTGQEATVRTRHGTADWFQIGRGVCQGHILSPCLFNLYAEYIMRNTGLEEAQAGSKISGRNISSVQFSRSVVSDSLHPMNCSVPSLPVHHQLPEFAQTHVHWVSDAIQSSHPLSSPSLPAPNPHGKEMQKSKMAVWGGLTNSCEKKRSEKQRRKGQI